MDEPVEEKRLHRLSALLGEPFRVLVQAPLFASRVEADILGYVAGEYVVLHSHASMSGPGLGTLSPSVGDSLIVRFLVDGIAYGFTSSVLHVLYRPELLVFLRYPDVINQVSVRRDRRIPCRLPCILIDETGERIAALLLNISAGGSKVVSRVAKEEHRKVGAPIKLELTLPPAAGGTHEIAGTIVRLSQQHQSIIAGVGFEQNQSELMEKLCDFLCLDDAERGDEK